MRITETDLNALDNKLLRYSSINREIALRREELTFPHKEGISVGSKGNTVSRPTETAVIKLDSDVKLRNLILFKDTVEALLEGLDEEQKKIFHLWTQRQFQVLMKKTG